MSPTPWGRATHRLALGALVGAMLGPQATIAGGPGVATAVTQASPTDRLIVKYRDGTPGATAAQRGLLHRAAQDAALRRGVQLTHLRIGVFDAHVMRLDRALAHADVQALARDIMASDPDVAYAEPDRVLHPQFTPNDTQYGQQWHYFEATAGINLPAAWDKSTGSGVVVAVLDTGYRPHADLAANVLPGYDMIMDAFVANDGTARDNDARDPGDHASAGACGGLPLEDETSSWHGTHVAGTIAAVSNNASGVAGVAFNAKILPVRVLGRCGGYMSDIAAGIVWASGGTVSGLPANPLIRESFGIVLVLVYVFVLPVVLARTSFKVFYEKLGGPRYYVTVILFLMMMSLPLKMLARWIFNLKYVVAIPEIFFNI